MPKKFLTLALLAGIALSPLYLLGVSLDGTTGSSLFRTHNHVFRNGDMAQGFIYFADGFTVLPDAQVTMDCVTSISGAIDLRKTGKLFLAKDLVLDSHVTFSEGGYFSSKGMGITLGGDATLPRGSIFHCAGEMIIDGAGNTLHLEPDAQLFLDNYSTLTLRNMIIKTEQSYPGKPSLHVSTSLSKLCFDNVVLNLGNDLYLNKGQFFFHNDVMVTGTSALIYASPAPSFIASGSTLYFDQGTTFSYAPCTNRSDLIRLVDKSSALHLHECSLKTTFTTMQLVKGNVFFNGRVNIDTGASFLFNTLQNTTSQLYGKNVYAVAWSPDQKYLAVGGRNPAYFGGVSNSNHIQIYAFKNEQLIPITSSYYPSDFIHILYWSIDGRYLFAGGSYATQALLAYEFDGSSLRYIISKSGGSVWIDLAISPDGRHLARYDVSASDLYIYNFDGFQFLNVCNTTTLTYGDHCPVTWSADGMYIALGGNNIDGMSSDVIIYRFTGKSLVLVKAVNLDLHIRAIAWSPDGKYLAAGSSTGKLIIYSFNGSTITFVTQISVYNGQVWGVPMPWSIDGQYIFVGVEAPIGYPDLYVYRFDGKTLTYIASTDVVSSSQDEFVRGSALSPDGRYIAYGGESNDPTSVIVKKLFWNGSGTPPYFVAHPPVVLGDGINVTNNCTVEQLPSSILNIQYGELRVCPAGESLPSDYPYNVVSSGMWKINTDQAQRLGVGAYTLKPLIYKTFQDLKHECEYQGMISFVDGFSVPAEQNAILTISQPIKGSINLHDTGTLTLERDLTLAPQTHFVAGGTISADDKTIVLQGDITLPFEKIITCSGSIIIDGNGKTLHVQPHAQLLVDAQSTLTLRNMTIISERMGDSTPALWCNATGKLCFDNVILNMSEDLPINQGKVFIHNDVIVSGTHALMYQSPHVFTIGPASTLYFDQDTTFSFSPQSDALERLHFADSSSRIMFDGAYFISTGNDLQLLQGRIFFDGLSHFEHYGAVYQGGNWVAATDKVCMFGDGVHAALDCNLSLLPCARLIIKGNVVYNSAI